MRVVEVPARTQATSESDASTIDDFVFDSPLADAVENQQYCRGGMAQNNFGIKTTIVFKHAHKLSRNTKKSAPEPCPERLENRTIL